MASWKLNVKKYFFKYRKGFFELSMIANSPQIMIHNFGHMPFVKHDPMYQTVRTENLFLNVKIFYQQLEENLLLMISDGYYKQNVLDVMLYDEREPLEHYFLSLKTSNRTVDSASTLVNGTTFSLNTWSLCKPGGIKNVCHFKKAKEHFFTVYFTRSWLENYLQSCDESTVHFFQNFLAAETTFLMCPRLQETFLSDFSLFYNVFNENKLASDIDNKSFREQALLLFQEFADGIKNHVVDGDYFNMTNENRLKIIQAENYLLQYITQEFPGVDWLADKVGISPSGLKNGFKQIYGCSIYKYFRRQKMIVAQAVLSNNKGIMIKDVAEQMGYSSAAKFTAAFKEEIGVLPSEMIISE